MKLFFRVFLRLRDIWPWDCTKSAQTEVFGHFLDFALLVFFDFAHNDRWTWCLVVFLQFAGTVNVFLFSSEKKFKFNLIQVQVQTLFSEDLDLLYFHSQKTFLQAKIFPWLRKFSTNKELYTSKELYKSQMVSWSRELSTNKDFSLIKEVFYKQRS